MPLRTASATASRSRSNGLIVSDQIAVLLPFPERFSPRNAGAISLRVRDATRASRYRNRIAIYGKPVEEPFAGFDYRPIQPRGRWLLGRNRGLAEGFWHAIRNDPPAMVEVHNRPRMFFHLAMRSSALPLALHLHNDPTKMDALRSPAQRMALARRAVAVYCVSDYIRARFLDGLDIRPDNVHVLHNGIERPWPVLPEKEKLIVFAGRIIPEKGAREFVEAVAAVLPRHPGWQAVMVGAQRPGQAGPVSEYEKTVYERFSGIGPAARFLGYQPHEVVMDLYARAAIAILPSIWDDPFPRAAVEALAAGCALITSERGGLAEMCRGRSITLADPNGDTIARELDRLLSDESALTELQRRAWEDFPFGIGAQTARQDGLRDALLQGPTAPALTA